MRLRSLFIVVSLAALIAACGGGAKETPTAPRPAASPSAATQSVSASQAPTSLGTVSPTTAAVPSAPAVGGEGTSVVHVVVASGPQAGTFDSTGVKSDCNISPSGSGASFVDVAKTSGVGSAVFSAVGGGAAPTAFYFQLLFAPISINPPAMEISTVDPNTANGSATAALVDTGATLKWTIDGKTKDGVGVTATIECGPVDRT